MLDKPYHNTCMSSSINKDIEDIHFLLLNMAFISSSEVEKIYIS